MRQDFDRGAGTLRPRMHAQALLCSSTVTVGRSGSGAGTLRACMHAQALLCATTVTVGRSGSGAGTLRAACTRRLAGSPPGLSSCLSLQAPAADPRPPPGLPHRHPKHSAARVNAWQRGAYRPVCCTRKADTHCGGLAEGTCRRLHVSSCCEVGWAGSEVGRSKDFV